MNDNYVPILDNNLPSINDINDIMLAAEYSITRRFIDFLSFDPVNQFPAQFDFKDLRLAVFKNIKFRKPYDIQKGTLDFLDSVNLINKPFLYSVIAKDDDIKIIFGLYNNHSDIHFSLKESFGNVLESVKGFFPGCEIEPFHGSVDPSNQFNSDFGDSKSDLPTSKEEWWSFLKTLTYHRAITGLPADKLPSGDQPQRPQTPEQTVFGLEELTDTATDKFALVIYAEPINTIERQVLIDNITNLHNFVHNFVKISLQKSTSESKSTTESENTGITKQYSETKGVTSGTSQSSQSHLPSKIFQFTKTMLMGGPGLTIQKSEQTSHQESDSEGTSETRGKSTTTGGTTTQGLTVERTNKNAAYLEDLLNRLHKRFTVGNGLWSCFTEVFAENSQCADKIARLLCGILSGEDSRLEPLRSVALPASVDCFNFDAVSLYDDHPLGDRFSRLSSVLTTSELAKITRLPLHEIPGVPVDKLADFGRNWPASSPEPQGRRIVLGNLVDHEIESKRSVEIGADQFLRHSFVSGATGSGKSNTMRHLVSQLWTECHVPFLVIEPVKREYRELQSSLGPDLLFYALGEPGSDFSLNPFDFDPSIGLIAHIDLLKAAFNASLGMYSSMPFILEHILYQAYEGRGWDLSTGENAQLRLASAKCPEADPAALRTLFLPVMSDLPPLVEGAIANFFPNSTDYSGSLLGALKSRLTTLTRGAKGALLDRQRSAPLDEILSRPCVLELWPFTDNEEKSLVMALILMRLYEHRQSQEMAKGASDSNPLKHLLVIEEAHRLLSKPGQGGEHSAHGRQKGVEVFADILAEIRSYGQGIVIVDQIPSKLIPDVLRNTDLKIAHRLVDKEDRQVLGATMNLDEAQIEELARFSPGQAAVYFSGLRRALRVKVDNSPLPAAEERRRFPPRVDLGEWREAQLFGPIPQAGGALPERGRCAHWTACVMVYALSAKPDDFHAALGPALEGLPALVGAAGREAAVAGVMRDLRFIGEWLEDRFDVTRSQSLPLVFDLAALLRGWFRSRDVSDDLLRLRKIDLGIRLLQVAEGRRLTDLTDLFISFHLDHAALRFDFQSAFKAGLDRYKIQGRLDLLLETLRRKAQGIVFGLPLTRAALIELILRIITKYHSDDPDERKLCWRAYDELADHFGLKTGR